MELNELTFNKLIHARKWSVFYENKILLGGAKINYNYKFSRAVTTLSQWCLNIRHL